MHSELIARVVDLIQKTGDRIVLVDPQTGKTVVVMDLASYEKLMTGAASTAAPAATPPVATETPKTTPIQAPAATVTKTPETIPEKAPAQAKKTAAHSENPFRKRGAQLGVTAPAKADGLVDLTQEELIDKINRDIGAWKTAQERRRTDELQSAAQRFAQLEPAMALEEEERFYLEPIE